MHLKILYRPLIHLNGTLFCEYFDDKNFEGVFIEIFNVNAVTKSSVDVDFCASNILELNFNNFISVEYHHIMIIQMCEILIIKNREQENVSKEYFIILILIDNSMKQTVYLN